MEEINPDFSPTGIVGHSTMHFLISTNKQLKLGQSLQDLEHSLSKSEYHFFFPGSQYLHVSKYKLPFFKTMGIKLSNSVGQMLNTLTGQNSFGF